MDAKFESRLLEY